MVGVRLPKDTLRRVEQYADNHDISKSDALRRMIEKGVDMEEAGLAVAVSQKAAGTDREPMADGGQVVRPIIQYMGAGYALLGLSSFLTALSVLVYPTQLVVDLFPDLFSIMLSSLVLLSVTMLILYTELPEKADRWIVTKGRETKQRISQVVA